MKYMNDIDGNYHFKKYIESVGIKPLDWKDDVFSHSIFMKMASGSEYTVNYFASLEEAENMLEYIVEEISEDI